MLKNITRKTTISGKVQFCTSLFSKATGLMFSRKKERALVFDFKRRQLVPLHMLFVFYPIDVLFLDEKKRVVEIKQNFRPFAFYTPHKRARYVVEILAGLVKKSKTKLGDKIQF